MVARSTICPLPGSITGSVMMVCMIGSTNSSGMSLASSRSSSNSTCARLCFTRRTKSFRRSSRPEELSSAAK